MGLVVSSDSGLDSRVAIPVHRGDVALDADLGIHTAAAVIGSGDVGGDTGAAVGGSLVDSFLASDVESFAGDDEEHGVVHFL